MFMQKSPINALFLLFQESFTKLNTVIAIEETEKLALLVHHCLSGSQREFHKPQHILDVCKPLQNPLQTLAVLFHDVIYYQVDAGFPPETEEILQKFVEIKNGEVFIKPDIEKEYGFEICLQVFAFEKGQKLSPFGGLNEFLSAVIATKYLEKYLQPQEMLCIIACIEATIPFRLANEQGEGHFDILERKLWQINQSQNIQLSFEQVIEIVKLSVEVANQDVMNFAEDDIGNFLDNTWSLISEANTELNTVESYAYNISHYRLGLQKTEGFLRFLKPESVFHQYRDFPANFQYFQNKTFYNLQIATEYMATKLLNIAILEALALCTGGMVPVSMLAGHIRKPDNLDCERAEDYLPPISTPLKEDIHPKVYELLEYGRSGKSTFDMNHAPLSAYIYKLLGNQGVAKALQEAKKMFSNDITPLDFLEAIPKEVVSGLAEACSHIAISRRYKLKAFVG
jgi:hypothetical protein